MHNHDTQLRPDQDCGLSSCPQYALRATGAPPPYSDNPERIQAALGAVQADVRRRNDLAAVLETWWHNQAQEEAECVVPKAIEYSSTDLIDLGRQIASLSGWTDIGDAEATELGIAFYVAGKVSRVMGAVKDRRLPSRDTWFDIGVYSRMVLRVRETGGWPGV